MDVMGEVYESLGLYPRAQPLLERALDIQRRIHGPRNPETLKAADDLALLLSRRALCRRRESEKMGRETLDVRHQVLGPDHPETLKSMLTLALTLDDEGRYAEAEKIRREQLDIQRRVLGPEHPETAVSVYNLSCLAARQGRRNEALSLLREAVDHGAPAHIDLGIDKDPDLKSLHGDPRFDALVAKAHQLVSGGVAVKVMIFPGRNVKWIRQSPNDKKSGLILTTPTFEAVFFYDLRRPAQRCQYDCHYSSCWQRESIWPSSRHLVQVTSFNC
jgi:tetratricopeptide (TPR) repeat protein